MVLSPLSKFYRSRKNQLVIQSIWSKISGLFQNTVLTPRTFQLADSMYLGWCLTFRETLTCKKVSLITNHRLSTPPLPVHPWSVHLLCASIAWSPCGLQLDLRCTRLSLAHGPDRPAISLRVYVPLPESTHTYLLFGHPSTRLNW